MMAISEQMMTGILMDEYTDPPFIPSCDRISSTAMISRGHGRLYRIQGRSTHDTAQVQRRPLTYDIAFVGFKTWQFKLIMRVFFATLAC